jgi:G3E family GTPase
MDAKGAFDHIVIETSGIADPGPIVTTFWLDDALNGRVKFDGVVCLVDCWNFQISQPPIELIRQLTFANVVLLNKLDLLKGENAKIIAIRAFIHSINSECSIYECSYSKIPELSNKIFNLGGMQAIANNLNEFSTLSEFHYLSYDKLAISLPESSLDYERMENFIQNLLWEKRIVQQEFPQIEIYRIKGIFKTKDSIFLVHSVKEVYEITPIDQSISQVKEFKLILIGQNLPLEQEIKEFFHCC